MKILRIIYDFPPPWDGLAPFPYELSLAQAEEGHDITVICGSWPRAIPKLPPLPTKIRLIRIPREPFPGSFFFTTAPLAFLYTIKEIFRGKYDLIQGHGHLPIFYHFYRLFTPWIRKTPYDLFLHITAAGRREQAMRRGDEITALTRAIEWPLHEISDRIGCKVATHVFVTGNNVKKEALHHYRLPENKITVLENGVNPRLFSPEGVNMREELKLATSDKVILYVGVINDRKGLECLLDALPELDDAYHLLIIGTGKLSYLNALKTRAQFNKVLGRVTFLGYVPYPSLATYYRTANVFALPSSYEGFPKAVLEALASGVPVVASGFEQTHPIQGLTLLSKVNPRTIKTGIEESLGAKVDRDYIVENYAWQTLSKKVLAH